MKCINAEECRNFRRRYLKKDGKKDWRYERGVLGALQIDDGNIEACSAFILSAEETIGVISEAQSVSILW